MTLTVNHSTPADGSFNATGAAAWNASHTLSGTIEVVNGGTGQTTTTDAINALLPTQATNSGKYLTTNGTNTSWATVSGGGSPGGAPTQVQFNNSGSFGGSANFTWDGTNAQLGATGALRFADTDSSNYVAFKAPSVIGSNVNWTLPSTDGTAGQVLSTNGSGILSWVTVTITPTSPTNNTLPVVTGTPTVGETLQSTSGTWNGYPAPNFSYQWVRGASTNIGTNSPSYQLVDADLGSTVKCTVTATNTAGSASATSAPTANIAAGLPGAPTSVTATYGNAQATVTFTAPAITGGVAITGYTVTSSPGGLTATGSASPLTVTGLTNGTSYTFTVRATNSVGTGPASAVSNAVVPATSFSSNYLVIAGGGGSGWSQGGGGGAGGLKSSSATINFGTNYSITVGPGGPAGTAPSTAGNGNPSSISVLGVTTTGGGTGGDGLFAGTSGGSGGAGTGNGSTGTAGGAGVSGEGFAGGNGASGAGTYGAGGGGGAGAVGSSPGASNSGANGGVGSSAYTVWGAATSTGQNVAGTYYYAGGGGGGSNSNTATGDGGFGGGGDGGRTPDAFGVAGAVNTGGGGGGGRNSSIATGGGAGGKGIVIIRSLSDVNPASTSGSPTVVVSGGYRYYTFTDSGSITF